MTTMLHRLLRKTLTGLAIVVMMVTLGGCTLFSLNSFVLHDAKLLSFNPSQGAVMEMTIENRSLLKITVVGGELTANHKDQSIGTVYMKDPVVLPGRSTTTVRVNLGMRFSSPMAALRAIGVLKKSPEELTISGYGEGKVWFFRKRYERKDVPISKFISIFGAPSQYFE